MHIIPYPNGEWIGKEEVLSLPKKLTVDYGDFATYCTEMYAIRSGASVQRAEANATIQLLRSDELAPEEYHISINDNIKIHAATEQGVIWALATLFLGSKDGSCKMGELQDKPRYQHRGFHLDCARHFFSVDTIERIIDVAGLSKLNFMHWHLTNDQGWRIESEQYPLLTKDGEYYSKEDIKRIILHARKCGIEIIPEVNIPGHTSAILAAYPQFGCSGEPVPLRTCCGIFPTILCGGKDETLTFIKDILSETAELFPGKYFHAGGDEAPKSEWKKCPHCASRMAENNINEFEELQGWLLSQMAAHLQTLGKRTLCWNDGFLDKNFSDNVIVQQWTSDLEKNYTLPYWEAGGEVIFSDSRHCYFDYPLGLTDLEKVYSYVPRLDETDCADAPNTLGIESCLWTESIVTTEQLGEKLFPRLFAIAEIAWSNTRNYARFADDLSVMFDYLDKHGVSYTTLADANPVGKVRKKQIENFLLAAIKDKGQSEDSEKVDIRFLLRLLFKYFGIGAIAVLYRMIKAARK